MRKSKTSLFPQEEAWNNASEEEDMHVHHRSHSHWFFYWGHDAIVLFSGWPGSSKGMYALALIFVFSLAIIVECFSHFDIIKPGDETVAAGYMKAGLHGIRCGLAYMVMLAVMSFNGGIFLAAIFGHAVGRGIFKALISKKLGG